MSFTNKLNDTLELLTKLDEVTTRNTGIGIVKKQLLSLSEDLAKYKDINDKDIKPENNEIRSNIFNALNRINEIERNVKNKLIISEKYNSYLNSQ